MAVRYLPASPASGSLWLPLLLLFSAAAAEEAAMSDDQQKPVPFEVRLLAEPQDREHVDVDHVSYVSGDTVVDVPMLKEILAQAEDVRCARLVREPVSENDPAEVVLIEIDLEEEAAGRLRGVTSHNLGKQLAIIYEYRLLAAPPIREVSDGSLRFRGSGDDWPERAEEIVARLNGEHGPDQPAQMPSPAP